MIETRVCGCVLPESWRDLPASFQLKVVSLFLLPFFLPPSSLLPPLIASSLSLSPLFSGSLLSFSESCRSLSLPRDSVTHEHVYSLCP